MRKLEIVLKKLEIVSDLNDDHQKMLNCSKNKWSAAKDVRQRDDAVSRRASDALQNERILLRSLSEKVVLASC